MQVTILAIESSCDDTSAAVIQDSKIRSNIVANQEVHKEYGGVVPELASRAHQQHIIPVVDKALRVAGVRPEELTAIACTRGPGLLGSLLVGVSFAKAMALALNIPLIDVHHMKAHILAHFIEPPVPSFPFLCLTVSGGHTQLVRVDAPLQMTVLGETLDDAVGEAFDKTAKLLGLPYPGGPLIDRYAKEGNPYAFTFPMPQVEGLHFSFSGLKTSILNFLQKHTRADKHFVEKHLPDICASVQHTFVQVLLQKLEQAVVQTGITEVAIAGGVSANSALRAVLQQKAEQAGWRVFIPAMQYCTDNAAMIAMAAHFQYLEGDFASLQMHATARWSIS
ncbi:MAG: tRNA N6-adenosine threonylcarbamoyltransferase [Thermonema sp.]|uniref:tRNA (adenosine(37)-N6)-threonylcarbamoyltransferase complex transferase subunit TsaD n=1 Tax=Thermonema sp. TaxID=2231181 RepID=UPI0021DD82C1|nr:tRNA (adenosine(37)-N6)-threonylcarbamoyltransferase complex transferase subunit TsaD [Thermonema sp.]GIV38745.1 MAG: tRNA N6-adenosine threonylcarbamoyltransferase [Thermonema sp.]